MAVRAKHLKKNLLATVAELLAENENSDTNMYLIKALQWFYTAEQNGHLSLK